MPTARRMLCTMSLEEAARRGPILRAESRPSRPALIDLVDPWIQYVETSTS
jgi:hypothetical protein